MTLQGFFGVFRYSRRAVELVWSTSRPLTVWLASLTLLLGALLMPSRTNAKTTSVAARLTLREPITRREPSCCTSSPTATEAIIEVMPPTATVYDASASEKPFAVRNVVPQLSMP